MIIYRQYLLTYAVDTLLTPSPPSFALQKKVFFSQIWIHCRNSITKEFKIRVVGFVLKKLLTYFEMLIVPHAPHCVSSCFFILPHLTVWHSVLVSTHAPPTTLPAPVPPHSPTPKDYFFAPNFGEVEGAYWFGPVCPSVRLSLAAEKLEKR